MWCRQKFYVVMSRAENLGQYVFIGSPDMVKSVMEWYYDTEKVEQEVPSRPISFCIKTIPKEGEALDRGLLNSLHPNISLPSILNVQGATTPHGLTANLLGISPQVNVNSSSLEVDPYNIEQCGMTYWTKDMPVGGCDQVLGL